MELSGDPSGTHYRWLMTLGITYAHYPSLASLSAPEVLATINNFLYAIQRRPLLPKDTQNLYFPLVQEAFLYLGPTMSRAEETTAK